MSLRLLRHVCQIFAQQNYNTITNANYFNSVVSDRYHRSDCTKWNEWNECFINNVIWKYGSATSFVWSESIDFCEKRSYFLRFCRAYPYLRWFPDWSVEDYTQNHINWLIDQPSVRIRKMEAKILHSSCNACNSSMKYCNLHSCMLSKNAVSVLRALCNAKKIFITHIFTRPIQADRKPELCKWND